MNYSQFMDKQIMGLSGSQNNDFFDIGGGKKEIKEEILPSYGFQPIRSVGDSQLVNIDGSNVGGTRVWKSADSNSNSTNLGTYGSLDSSTSANVTQEKDCRTYDSVTMSEIDQTMKKHTDNLLCVLECVSARLSQLESRTRYLESSVDDVKISIGNDHGNTDGKLRQLENILREVQTGVQFLRDKQEIAEAQLQLAKLQRPSSKGQHQSDNQKSTEQTDSAPQQSYQPLMPPAALPQPSQPLPALPLGAPPLQQSTPPLPFPSQLPENQIPSIQQRDPYFPQPNQHYQSAPQLPQYSQPTHQPQQHPRVGPVNPPPQPQLPLSHHLEETSYMPPQNYPPSNRQPPAMSQPTSGPPPSQQFYGAPPNPNMYEPLLTRANSGFSSGYSSSSGPNFSDSYPYGSSMMKLPHISSSSAPSGGGSSYPCLPTAQILPHALPTASNDVGGSSSGGSGNKVPIDDVIDKVALMGFSRDQVRATVRKLTENGQSVDLNVVLDKLMNNGEVEQPQKGWFSR